MLDTRLRSFFYDTTGGTSSGGSGGSIVPPLIISSGGTGTTAQGSATTLVGMNSSGASYDFYLLKASDNSSVVRSGTAYFISALTNAGASINTASLVQSSRTISTVFPLSGGGDLSVDRSFYADTAFLINSSRTIATLFPLLGGGDFSANRTFSADTGFLVNTARQIISGNGLSGGGDLSADRTLSINTNVRDKSFGYFFAGSLSTLMLAQSAMIYIPYNMELRSIQLSVSHSAGGQNIVVQPTLYNGPLTVGSVLFNDSVRPTIVTNNLVGSNGAIGSNVLHAGSWLGITINSVGTTVIGSNLTVNVLVRTS